MIVVRTNNQTRGEVFNGYYTVGVDLAKHTFSVCQVDSQGRISKRHAIPTHRNYRAHWNAKS